MQNVNTGKFSTPKVTGTHSVTQALKNHAYTWATTPNLVHRLLILMVVSLLITYLLIPEKTIDNTHYRLGEIVQRTIQATKNYSVIDEASTKLLQQDAVLNVSPAFDFDPSIIAETVSKNQQLFSALESLKNNANAPEAMSNFLQNQNITVSQENLEWLVKNNQLRTVQRLLGKSIQDVIVGKYILDSVEHLPLSSKVGIEVRSIVAYDAPKDQPNPTTLKDFAVIIDLPQLKNELGTYIAKRLERNNDKRQQQRLAEIAKALLFPLIKPNLTYNSLATEEQKRVVSALVKPVTIPIQKGEIIVKSGDRLTPRQQLILSGIHQEQASENRLGLFAKNLLLILLVIAMLSIAAYKFMRSFNPTVKDLYVMACLLIGTVAITKLGNWLANNWVPGDSNLLTQSLTYALPISAGAVIIRMILNGSYAIYFSAILSFVIGALFNFDLFFAIFALVSSIFGAFIVEKYQTRTGLFKASLVISCFNLLVLMVYGYMNRFAIEPKSLGMIITVQLALGSILLFMVLSLLTPVVEYFDYITDMRLMELANFNNPLLNRLALEAPGTYHHSRVVAQLVEAAAESIGANPLLSMVSALYHDIGKTKAPQYFTENQTPETRNIHDKLKPSMSKMIIVAHIKDGIEMAKRAGLPSAIINGIPEHHGTSLITFFYHKAKDQEDVKNDPIDETEFRYPGPKPQSKETALLLLADSVEAATKALPDATAEKIQGVIQKIFNKYFADGQLNECDLTLKDLNLIAKSFFRTLSSVYKPRIEYPDVVPSSGGIQKVKKADAGRNQQSPKGAQNQPDDGDDEDGEDLKRLGL